MSAIIIESLKQDGNEFRPSNWIERLCEVAGTFDENHRLIYANQCKPSIVNGQRCLLVDSALATTNPSAYHHIMAFVKSNGLGYSKCASKIAA